MPRKSLHSRKKFKELAAFRKLYFSSNSSSAFTGKRQFLLAVKKKLGSEKKLLQRAEKWLNAQDTYTLHKPITYGKTKNRRPIIVSGIDSCWQMDLADLPQFAADNNSFRYILFVIDVFSRFAWAKALQNKTGSTIADALNDIFITSKRVPMYIQSDLGKEFFNKPVQSLLKQNNIHHYVTQNRDVKASICERLQRTIKDRLYRYFTHSSSYKYIDILPSIMKAYNDSPHSSLDMPPSEVTLENQEEVWNRQYHAKSEVYDARHYVGRFKEGDIVRVTKLRSLFEKGSLPNWTQELFTTTTVLPTKPITYTIMDMKSEPVLGTWYSWELQKVNTNNLYKIEKVLKKQKFGGKWRYFVKFLGYDDSFNDWVDNIVDYKN